MATQVGRRPVRNLATVVRRPQLAVERELCHLVPRMKVAATAVLYSQRQPTRDGLSGGAIGATVAGVRLSWRRGALWVCPTTSSPPPSRPALGSPSVRHFPVGATDSVV